MSWEMTKQLEANWTKDRPIIEASNTLYKLLLYVKSEVAELAPALCRYLLDPTEAKRKDTLQEASDVVIFMMAIFRLLDADMLEEVREKIAFNTTRMLAKDFKDGKYEDKYQESKKRVKEEKWRDTFYATLAVANLGVKHDET